MCLMAVEVNGLEADQFCRDNFYYQHSPIIGGKGLIEAVRAY